MSEEEYIAAVRTVQEDIERNMRENFRRIFAFHNACKAYVKMKDETPPSLLRRDGV
jgi:hypothetical protein